jgi:hypothetical protein
MNLARAAQELNFKFIFSFDYAGNGPFEIDTVIQTLMDGRHLICTTDSEASH